MYFGTGESKRIIYAKLPDNMDYSKNIVVSQLERRYIHRLTFSSCNSANPDAYNIAYGFMQQMNIYEITAWDGGTVFDYGLFGSGTLKPGAKGESNQHTWYRFVAKKSDGTPSRLRFGKRRFYQVNNIWTEDLKIRNNIIKNR